MQDLKYNTGDWKYQCFETFYVLNEEEVESAIKRIKTLKTL